MSAFDPKQTLSAQCMPRHSAIAPSWLSSLNLSYFEPVFRQFVTDEARGNLVRGPEERKESVSLMAVLRADEVEAQWYAWAESELGGSPARLQAIASAAVSAAAEGLDTASVIQAARRAAVEYDAGRITGDRRASVVDLRAQWLAWAQTELGGSPAQIKAAADAAMAAVAQGRSQPEIISAGSSSSERWVTR
jgi:hypothetical protein